MNASKQKLKLLKLITKAETCKTRSKAQKILRKVRKTQEKLASYSSLVKS